MELKKVVHTYFYLIFSQLVTLVLNILMSTVFPKILSVNDFGYWQLFLFYSSFVGFFHFGLNDGVYLRYGGKHIESVNKELLKGQFLLLILMQLILSFLLVGYQVFFGREEVSKIVFFTVIFMIFSNLSSFITVFFQASNKLRYFSNSTIITSVLFLIAILALFALKKFSLNYLIIFYLLSSFISFLYVIYVFKDFLKEKINNLNLKFYTKEYLANTYVGFFLMISTVSSMMILGIGRYLIGNKWGISIFGKVSLAFTIMTFMLFFIRQTSLVIFPLLKKTSAELQKKVLGLSLDFLNIILLGMLLVMPLVDLFITHWLPNYSESLKYFVYILPIALYEGKMQVILNTYMKVLRKEKVLMWINILSMVISAVLCLIGFYFGSLDFIILSMTVATICRGIILENRLGRHFHEKNYKRILMPLTMIVIFLYAFHFFNVSYASIIYFCAYLIFVIVNFASIKKLAVLLKKVR